MIWPDDVSFEGYGQKKSEWFNALGHFLGDPPIDAAMLVKLNTIEERLKPPTAGFDYHDYSGLTDE